MTHRRHSPNRELGNAKDIPQWTAGKLQNYVLCTSHKLCQNVLWVTETSSSLSLRLQHLLGSLPLQMTFWCCEMQFECNSVQCLCPCEQQLLLCGQPKKKLALNIGFAGSLDQFKLAKSLCLWYLNDAVKFCRNFAFSMFVRFRGKAGASRWLCEMCLPKLLQVSN